MQADGIIYMYIYPQTKFGGYIEISLPVRLSVRQVHIFFMNKDWNFLLYTNIVYDLRVCIVLDPRSFVRGQWQWQKKYKIRVQTLFL